MRFYLPWAWTWSSYLLVCSLRRKSDCLGLSSRLSRGLNPAVWRTADMGSPRSQHRPFSELLGRGSTIVWDFLLSDESMFLEIQTFFVITVLSLLMVYCARQNIPCHVGIIQLNVVGTSRRELGWLGGSCTNIWMSPFVLSHQQRAFFPRVGLVLMEINIESWLDPAWIHAWNSILKQFQRFIVSIESFWDKLSKSVVGQEKQSMVV